MLICPHCSRELRREHSAWRCSNGHAFDVGKNGDVNLLLPQQKRSLAPGDSKEMVAMRRAFLSTGVYQPIAAQLCQLIGNTCTTRDFDGDLTIADAGCGEGYYLRFLENSLPTPKCSNVRYLGWDISKFAVQAAAKQQQSAQWLTASNAHIPLQDSTVDVLLSMFGFAVPHEFARIMKSSGKMSSMLVCVDAGPKHLIEIRERIYPTIKPYKDKNLSDHQLMMVESLPLTYSLTLDGLQLSQLVKMTPHFYRAQGGATQRIFALDTLDVTIDIRYTVYELRSGGVTTKIISV